MIGSLPTIEDVRSAAARLQGVAHRTPVLTSRSLDLATGASLFLKAECFQRTGSFKFRGAYNAIASLTEIENASLILWRCIAKPASRRPLAITGWPTIP